MTRSGPDQTQAGPREGSVVGFVGLGRMGWPMAGNLVRAGFAVIGRDLDPGLQQRFAAEHGCGTADTPGELARAAIVVTMLPDDQAVRRATLDWGLADALPAGAVLVDMSSSNPRGTRQLGAELARRQITLLDAPVSGGIPRAETATLTIMLGGDDETAVEQALPVLRTLGRQIFRTGPLGSGHAMKALNNYQGAAAYAAAAEALAIGRHYGLTPDTIIQVINASTGRSFNSEHVYAEHVLTHRYATGFSLGLMAKDLAIAADLAAATGLETPLLHTVNRRWDQALTALGPHADQSEAHRTWWVDGQPSVPADTM